MDVRKLALLIGALVIAAVTAVVAKNMFTGAGAAKAEAAPVPLGPEILVATRALPVGTIIDAESLRFQPWPKELVGQAYFTRGAPGSDPSKLLGTVVRNPITAGQPVTQGSLVKPGERGFLAAALAPGMRAVTVSVSATSGVAGFVFPGDRVDVLLTQEVKGGGDGPPLKASETILRNMRVLATDQRSAPEDVDGKRVVTVSTTVTLEATPTIAEKIAVAQTIGAISLSLRSLADNGAELERAIASGAIDVPAGKDLQAAKREMLVTLAARPMERGSTTTVGSDVSRYQRSSVPARPREVTAQKSGGDDFKQAMTSMGGALGSMFGGARQPAMAGEPRPSRPAGPTVTVARGNSVTVTSVESN